MIPTHARREDSLRRSSVRHPRFRALVAAHALVSTFIGATTIVVAATTASRPASTDPSEPVSHVVADPMPSATARTDPHAPIADFGAGRAAVAAPPTRPTTDTPAASADSVVRERIRARGQATWYCLTGASPCHRAKDGGMYAAAGPELRVGDWRGRRVSVCLGDDCVRVTLIDWCACAGDRVIDLYSDAFRRLASLSTGTIPVTVRW